MKWYKHKITKVVASEAQFISIHPSEDANWEEIKPPLSDGDFALSCDCGSVHFSLRRDGFCECFGCKKTGLYQWEDVMTSEQKGERG